MAARYGHAWVSQYGVNPDGFAAAEWRDALAGLTQPQLEDGFRADRLRGSDWPPSSTAFAAACLGVPSFASVLVEFHGGLRNPTRFARGVWLRLDTFSFARCAQRDADVMLRRAYDATAEAVLRGDELPCAPLATLSKDQPVARPAASDQKVAEYLAAIEAELYGYGLPDAGNNGAQS